MKKINKFLAVFMSFMIIISCVGCRESSENTGDKDGTYATYNPSYGKVEGTTHERIVEETSKKFIANNATEYKIIIATNAGTYVEKAVAQFKSIIYEATGVSLQTVKSDSVEYDETAKYISLGTNNFLDSAQLEFDYEKLGSQGYEIVTKGDAIFVGGTDKGVYFGVLDLLNILVDWDMLTSKYYHVNKNVTEIPLYKFDIKEVPDIEYRMAPFGSVFSDRTACELMRLTPDGDVFMKNANTHSSLNIVTLEDNKASHPKWFSKDELQLCYTAGGDSEEYDALINYAVEQCKKIVDNDQDNDTLSFSQMDYNVWCDCSGCLKIINKYGTKAATQILFINDVAEKLIPWAENKYPHREIILDILAYHQAEVAPTVYKNGKYELVAPEMKLHDSIQLMVAPVNSDFISGVFADNNISLKNIFLSWQPVTSRYSVWSYDSYFGSGYLAPYDSWGATPDFIKFVVSLNTRVIFPEGAYNQRRNSNFDNLKTYIYSKILWNANLDTQEIIDEYFDKLYRDASQTMKNAYFNMRAELNRHTLMGRDGSIWTVTIADSKYFSKSYLTGQIKMIEKAFGDVKKYKDTDIEFYNMVCDEITLETIGHRWMLIHIYNGLFSNTELKEFAKALLDDMERLDINTLGEGSSTPADYMAQYL